MCSFAYCYITHLNVEPDWLSITGKAGSRGTPYSSHNWGCISSLVSTRGVPVGNLLYKSMSALLPLENHLPLGDLRVNTSNYSWTYQSKLCVPSLCISSSSSVYFSIKKTYHRSVQTLYSGGSFLDWGFLASHCSQKLIMDFSVDWMHKCLWWLYLTHWLLRDEHCTDEDSLPHLSGSRVGSSSVYNKILPAMLEETAGLCAEEGVLNCHFCPWISWFFVHIFQVGLLSCRFALYYSALLAFFNVIIITRYLIISNLCIIFIYSTPLYINSLILHVKC